MTQTMAKGAQGSLSLDNNILALTLFTSKELQGIILKLSPLIDQPAHFHNQSCALFTFFFGYQESQDDP